MVWRAVGRLAGPLSIARCARLGKSLLWIVTQIPASILLETRAGEKFVSNGSCRLYAFRSHWYLEIHLLGRFANTKGSLLGWEREIKEPSKPLWNRNGLGVIDDVHPAKMRPVPCIRSWDVILKPYSILPLLCRHPHDQSLRYRTLRSVLDNNVMKNLFMKMPHVIYNNSYPMTTWHVPLEGGWIMYKTDRHFCRVLPFAYTSNSLLTSDISWYLITTFGFGLSRKWSFQATLSNHSIVLGSVSSWSEIGGFLQSVLRRSTCWSLTRLQAPFLWTAQKLERLWNRLLQQNDLITDTFVSVTVFLKRKKAEEVVLPIELRTINMCWAHSPMLF